MNGKIPSYFILDVDGVLTDGKFIYSKEGKLYKVFGPHDHDGIKMIQKKIKIIFVTADSSGFDISKKRLVDDMKQTLLLVKEKDRLTYLVKNFDLKHSIYMGDGYFDAPILKYCFYGIAPANAREEAKQNADFITPSSGGNGAVLDACIKIKELFLSNGVQDDLAIGKNSSFKERMRKLAEL